jgi:hypothetical protein
VLKDDGAAVAKGIEADDVAAIDAATDEPAGIADEL